MSITNLTLHFKSPENNLRLLEAVAANNRFIRQAQRSIPDPRDYMDPNLPKDLKELRDIAAVIVACNVHFKLNTKAENAEVYRRIVEECERSLARMIYKKFMRELRNYPKLQQLTTYITNCRLANSSSSMDQYCFETILHKKLVEEPTQKLLEMGEQLSISQNWKLPFGMIGEALIRAKEECQLARARLAVRLDPLKMLSKK